MDINDEQNPGRIAYEKYLHVSEGKSLISGAVLPKWIDLMHAIKLAWVASADPSAPRWIQE